MTVTGMAVIEATNCPPTLFLIPTIHLLLNVGGVKAHLKNSLE